MDSNNMSNYNRQLEEPNSVGDWVLTIFLVGIPCVGLILLLVWAFGNDANKSKSNWAKATLIWMLVGVVISIIMCAIFGAALMEVFKAFS